MTIIFPSASEAIAPSGKGPPDRKFKQARAEAYQAERDARRADEGARW
jgi:hypothetical protein